MTGPIPGAIVKPLNVAFARSLPYTVLVTDMGMNDMNAMVPQTMSMDTNNTTSGLRVLGSGKFLHTGIMAHGVAVLPGTSYAFVSDFMGATVKEVNIKTMQVVRTFAVGVSPTHTVFLPNHRYAFVSDFGSNDLSRLDIQTGQVRSISFPKHDCFKPHGLTLSADGGTLYVACAGDAWIYTIDTQTLRPQHLAITGPGAYGVEIDQQRHELWVPNQTANTVSVLDLRTLKPLATIALGKGMGPALEVIAPDGRTVYVADLLAGKVSVIDAAQRKVTATLSVAGQPFGPTITPDGKYLYVPSIKASVVTIIRTSDLRTVAVVPAAVGAVQVAIAQ